LEFHDAPDPNSPDRCHSRHAGRRGLAEPARRRADRHHGLPLKKWVSYLQANGFTVKSIEQEDLSGVKADAGVTGKLASCHTALVQGYVIEGHVPAADIQRLLREKPKVTGLTAPGMPGAGPGMDAGKDPFDVLTFDAKGKTTVWAKH
jgi:hypothetical protein